MDDSGVKDIQTCLFTQWILIIPSLLGWLSAFIAFLVKFVFILLAYFNYTMHDYFFVVKYFYRHNFKIPCGHIVPLSKQIGLCTSQEAEPPSLAAHTNPEKKLRKNIPTDMRKGSKPTRPSAGTSARTQEGMSPTRVGKGAPKSLPRPASDLIARLLSAAVLPHSFFIFAQRSEIPLSCISHRGQVGLADSHSPVFPPNLV